MTVPAKRNPAERRIARRLGNLLSLALIALSPSHAFAQEAPRLKHAIEVTTASVTLGDLLTHAGEQKDKPVFLAPQPGNSGFISASRVIEAARAVGIEPSLDKAPDRIKVARIGRAIDLAELSELLRKQLVQQHPDLADSELDIRLQGTLAPTFIDPALREDIQTNLIDWSPRTGAFHAEFTLPGGTKLPVAGTAQSLRLAIVLRTDIQAGTILTAEDLETKPLAAGVNGNTITDATLVIGKAAKKRLKAATPLQESDLTAPLVVQRNQLVSIILDFPGLKLRAEGKALADAARGEGLKVMNTQSKRIINATAVEPGVVSVGPAVHTNSGS